MIAWGIWSTSSWGKGFISLCANDRNLLVLRMLLRQNSPRFTSRRLLRTSLRPIVSERECGCEITLGIAPSRNRW